MKNFKRLFLILLLPFFSSCTFRNGIDKNNSSNINYGYAEELTLQINQNFNEKHYMDVGEENFAICNVIGEKQGGTIDWVYSNPSILKVTPKGGLSQLQMTFKALEPGTCEIYCVCRQNHITSNKITLIIVDDYSLKINGDSLGLENGLNTGTKIFDVYGKKINVYFQNIKYAKNLKKFSFLESTDGGKIPTSSSTPKETDSFIYFAGLCGTYLTQNYYIGKAKIVLEESYNDSLFSCYLFGSTSYCFATFSFNFSQTSTHEVDIARLSGGSGKGTDGIKICSKQAGIDVQINEISFHIGRN